MTVRAQWLGRVGYRWAWRLQHLRREAVLRGTAPEAIWLLEHPPVITTGRRFVEHLPESGIPVVHTERGGLATYHGPGQLVGYLILDVRRRRATVRGTVAAVENAVILWLRRYGVNATTRSGHPGVWVEADKICALGFHFRRGVSMHGFALNITTDLDGYSGIIPCGIRDGGVTSMAVLGLEVPDMMSAADQLGRCVVDTLGRCG